MRIAEGADFELSDRFAGRDSRIYALADLDALGRPALVEAVRLMAAGGVQSIQIRAKSAFDDELAEDISACCEALDGSGVEIWVNDRPDLARISRVHGVHLGQADLQAAAARSVVGPLKLVGRSTHNEAQVREADADEAVDVIAIGPIYATSGKRDAEAVVGIRGLRRARLLTSKRLVAIGGIGEHNLGEILDAGADSAAMLGAVCQGDIESNCRRLVALAGAPA